MARRKNRPILSPGDSSWGLRIPGCAGVVPAVVEAELPPTLARCSVTPFGEPLAGLLRFPPVRRLLGSLVAMSSALLKGSSLQDRHLPWHRPMIPRPIAG